MQVIKKITAKNAFVCYDKKNFQDVNIKSSMS